MTPPPSSNWIPISAEQYSPDDNRFDLRPFLTPVSDFWWPFRKMQNSVEDWEAQNKYEGNHERDDETKHEKEHEDKHKHRDQGGEHESNHEIKNESDHKGGDYGSSHDSNH